jgi:hypothetical protein
MQVKSNRHVRLMLAEACTREKRVFTGKAVAVWRIGRQTRRLGHRGAIIVRVLILMDLGAVEIGNALTIYRRTSAVASTAADLTAQVKTVSTADLKDIVSASGSILTPYSVTPLKVVLSSVVADQNNNGKVAWSYASKSIGACRQLGPCGTGGPHRAQ